MTSLAQAPLTTTLVKLWFYCVLDGLLCKPNQHSLFESFATKQVVSTI
jgi:hypothetical protein